MPINNSDLFLVRVKIFLRSPRQYNRTQSIPHSVILFPKSEIRNRDMEPAQEMQTLDSILGQPKAGRSRTHDKDTLALAKTGKKQVLQAWSTTADLELAQH